MLDNNMSVLGNGFMVAELFALVWFVCLVCFVSFL